jgi:predicted amidohydrolase YtcJ
MTTLIYNGQLFAPHHPGASAAAIQDGQFIAIGSDSDILESFPIPEKKINLQGRTIWPGLCDSHIHLKHLALSMANVDCETPTLAECLQRVKKAAARSPKGAWLRGHGWNQNLWSGQFGTAEQLDQITNDKPAYLTAKSLHAGWANTKALTLARIDASTPDPPGGEIQRFASGKPTGILFEKAMQLVEAASPQPNTDTLSQMIQNLLPKLWETGLVAVHDFDGNDCWKALKYLSANQDLKLRVHKSIPVDWFEDYIQKGLATHDGTAWLSIGAVKCFADGALGPQTAAMLTPYEGSHQKGKLLLSEEEIFDIGQQCVRNHLALSIHAIGDLANRTVLNAFSRLRDFEKENALPPLPHRIEHVQILHPDDLKRLKELAIIASVQPVHAPSDMVMAEAQLGERAPYAYAYGSMLRSGIQLIFGSDAPVESFNPFLGLHAAVTRQRVDGLPNKDGWYPAEKIPLREALFSFTKHPADVIQQGQRLGKIEIGYRADFIILPDNPFNLQPAALWSIKPQATFINGTCVYQNINL